MKCGEDAAIKKWSNQILHYTHSIILRYIEACNELVGPISASLRLGNTASFKEMLQR